MTEAPDKMPDEIFIGDLKDSTVKTAGIWTIDQRGKATHIRYIRADLPAAPVDALANEIRRLNGNNDMGAGALAEALMPFIQRQLPAQEWQPIETAPKDGTEILTTSLDKYPDDIFCDRWYAKENRWSYDAKPTHWMPLPKPPIQAAIKE